MTHCRKTALLTALALSLSIAHAESTFTVNVAEPGTLNIALLDSPTGLDRLSITGTLNNADLNVIHNGYGVLSSVKCLDLSEVQCVTNEEEPYISIDHTRFFFSAREESEIVDESSPDSWIVSDKIYTYFYSRSLAGVFALEAPYKKVILPAYAYPATMAFYENGTIEEVEYLTPAVEIGDKAFERCGNLRNVTLSDNLTTVGERAFMETKVSAVNLSKVNKLGAEAFRSAPLTGSIDLQGVDSIPDRCFYETGGLTSVKLSSTLRWIGNETFYASGLTTYDLPASLEYIGQGGVGDYHLRGGSSGAEGGIYYINGIAYSYDSETLPSAVTFRPGTKSVSSSLLYRHPNITSIKFPEGLRYIGHDAFWGLDNLESVEFSEGLEQIGENAFGGNAGLAISALPQSLRVIGAWAFSNSNGITELTLPSSIKQIGENAFYNCDGVARIYYDVVDCGSTSVFSGQGAQKLTIGPNVRLLPQINAPNLLMIASEERTVDAAEFEMVDNSFVGSEVLQTIELPSTTSSIAPYAFSGCAKLKSFSLKEGPRAEVDFVIGDGAFKGTESLLHIDLPDNTVEIGDGAFIGSGLTEISLPASLKVLGQQPFGDCLSGQEMLIIPSSLESFAMDKGRREGSFCSMGVKGVTIPACLADKGIELHSLPNLKSIIIEDGTETVDISTYDSNFSEIRFPKEVKHIKGGFYSNALTELYIPDGVSEIGLIECENMTSLSLPAECVSAEGISGKMYELDLKWRIPEGYVYNGPTEGNVIKSARGVMGTLILPEGVNTFGYPDYPRATVTNADLNKIVLPSTLKQLTYRAFNQSIYPEITCYAPEPPAIIGEEAVLCTNNGYLRGTLYVPAASIEKYKDSGFRNFTILPIAGSEEDAIGSVQSANCEEVVAVYDSKGIVHESLPSAPGIYIVVYSDGHRTKIRR